MDALASISEEIRKKMEVLSKQYKHEKEAVGITSADELPEKAGSRKVSSKASKNNDNNRGRRSLRSRRGSNTQRIVKIQDFLHGRILRLGGTCHFDTLCAILEEHWDDIIDDSVVPETQAASPTKAPDHRKMASNALESDKRILRDSSQRDYWSTSPPSDMELEPLTMYILKAIEAYDGSCHVRKIEQYVVEQWTHHLPDLAPEDIRKDVMLTLSTNPKFLDEKEDGSTYSLSKGRRRNRKFLPVESDTLSRPAKPSWQGSRRLVLPPPGVSCVCGKKVPERGQYCRWVQLEGVWKCYECSRSSSSNGTATNGRRGSASTTKRGRVSQPLRRNVGENTSDEDDDNDPWICCDGCEKWLRAKSDGITDLSIYDDSNPNHLDYYCPECRKKKKGTRGKKRGSSKRAAKADRGAGKAPKKKKVSSAAGATSYRGGGAPAPSSWPSTSCIEKQGDVLEEEFEQIMLDAGEMFAPIGKKFMNDFATYKASLIRQREKMFKKNQQYYERQIRSAERERDKLNVEADEGLSKQLEEYFMRKKRKILEPILSEDEEGAVVFPEDAFDEKSEDVQVDGGLDTLMDLNSEMKEEEEEQEEVEQPQNSAELTGTQGDNGMEGDGGKSS